MVDFQLLKNKILHLTNIYQISFKTLYYEYIKVPYSLEFQHNAKMVFYLLIHYLIPLFKDVIGLLLYQNLLILFNYFEKEEYFQVLSLYEQFSTNYEE